MQMCESVLKMHGKEPAQGVDLLANDTSVNKSL